MTLAVETVPDSGAPASSSPTRRAGQLLRWPGLVVLALLVPQLLTDAYWLQVLVSAETVAIAAIGLYITFGMSGQVSLGHAGFYAIGGYATALLVTELGAGLVVAVVASALMAALAGLIVGFPALRLHGHYLALATLGFGQVVVLVLLNWVELTGGAVGIRGVDPAVFGELRLRTPEHWAMVVGVLVVVVMFLATQLRASSFGRAMHAVRDSEIAAECMGVSPSRVKLLAFVIGASLAGLAGALNASYITYVSPGTYTLQLSVAMLAMVVIGGAGSPWGAVIGAGLLTFLPEVLRPLQEYYLLMYGLLLLLMVDFAPGGLLGLGQRGSRLLSRFLPGHSS